MSKAIKERLEQCLSKLAGLEKHLQIAVKKASFQELEALSQSDGFWNDQKKAQSTMKELNHLKDLLEKWEIYRKNCEDVGAILELMEEEEEGSDFGKEAEEKLGETESGLETLEFRRMLSGEYDQADAILYINSGAGGTESCDWAEMLLRMYRRWCDRHGYKHEVVDFSPGEEAGLKSAVMTVEGEYAYGYLKAEIGVHRLVRISPFDSNKRRHTSFASVYALPDIEEDIDIEINDSDLRIDTFRSGGAGGQHVNKTESAVRITHIPSGLVVVCRNEKSQHQNRATAMKLLKVKLYEEEIKKREEARASREKEKKKIEWGSQIRSYVMHPYQMAKDHRTNLEIGNVDSVMDGNLDPFIRKFLMEYS